MNSTNNTNSNTDSSSILNSVNTNNNNMNSNHNNMNMNSNNNNMSSMRTDSLNINNSGLVNPNNTPGEAGYASLPVLETYVPDNIVSDVKQRHPNTVVYDITAVKAPVDSSAMNQGTSMSGMNDSSMNQNTTANSTTNQNSTTMNSNNNMNSTTNNMNMNHSNGMAQDSTMAKPQEYNYIVRFDQNGQMTEETLNNDGTALVQRNPGWNNQKQ